MKKFFAILLFTAFASNLLAQNTENTPFKSNIDSDALKTVMRAVADWQLKTPLTHHQLDWTNGALYTGMVEWAKVADDSKYFDWLREIGVKNSWNYFKHDNPLRRYHADDYCVGQMYIEMYRQFHDKKMIEPIRDYLDQIMKDPASGDLKFVNTREYWSTQRWSWCDALFMAPTVWAKIARETGKKKYLDFMLAEYKVTTDYLFDKDENLYFRDSNYFTRKENNGSKVFWGRGNGWVFAGLPIIIRELPNKYKGREYFVDIFKKMAGKLLILQDPEGYWHASLLDPQSYPNPEMSATSFFVFGMAWGINNGYLDRETYMPAVEKGWKSMVASVWPDGKVGYIQPIGADPKSVTREMTEVYGVGGFLLAGTELLKMISR